MDVLRIADHELVLFVSRSLERGPIAIPAKQLACDAVERAREMQLERGRRGNDLGYCHSFARADVECLAQPRQIEREKLQGAVALQLERSIEQVGRAGRQCFAATNKFLLLENPGVC